MFSVFSFFPARQGILGIHIESEGNFFGIINLPKYFKILI